MAACINREEGFPLSIRANKIFDRLYIQIIGRISFKTENSGTNP